MSKIVSFQQYGGHEVLGIEATHVAQISVKAININRTKSMWRAGVYVEPVKLPARLGYEVSGIISAIGSDVDCQLRKMK